MEQVFEFIKNREGTAPIEAARGLPHLNKSTVLGAVQRLYIFGQIDRFKGSSCFLYIVPSSAAEAGDSRLKALEERALELQKKGMWRRAATVWLACYDQSKQSADRETYMRRRVECLSGFSRGVNNGCLELSGRFIGDQY
ncbi:PerC family transcriptional regulator [Lelliottia sp. SL45]|uniref:PerC family transcriptional regulator n=1 Tax=Lelliottia sp. SL45 TaxID=2994665 RepID=UPI0022734F73|nr:PerC family transcriptional regulator [Lelliottia sp. SL45]MCY1699500.1 PerC family transcriptional regulator [Lelliottia sp. SL45]